MSTSVGFWEHFKRLIDFKGREDRASFWPYAALVFGLSVVGSWAVMIPTMATTMTKMQQFAAQHPDQVNVVSGPGEYSVNFDSAPPDFIPNFSAMFGGMAVVMLVAVLLYAAAVVRRLHDRDMAGWWGLMPIPFVLYSSIQMPRVFGSFGSGQQPDMSLFFSIFLSNMLYLIALVVLVVLLAGAGSPGPNRYDATT